MTNNYYEAIRGRRSYYGISKEVVATNERIQEIVEHAIKHTPSAFNSQSARAVLLLGDHHTKLWDITKEALRKIVPADEFAETEEKINSFNAGYGTVLFFEDKKVVEFMQEQVPLYKDNFPIWSLESSGMHQYNVWVSLKLEGYGASLQHYNELIEDAVKKEWGLDANWQLRAQMPFGKPTAEPGEKQFNPLEDRMKVYK